MELNQVDSSIMELSGSIIHFHLVGDIINKSLSISISLIKIVFQFDQQS